MHDTAGGAGHRAYTAAADFRRADPGADDASACAQQLGHARDDVRLRDRLSGANGKRRIFVRTNRQRFFDEDVSRHAVHRGKHRFVAYALFTQALHHARAGARGSHPDAVEFLDTCNHAAAPCKSVTSHFASGAICE